MYITAIAVASLDGRIATKEGDSHSWVSAEDQQIFLDLKNKFSVLVMGKQTYISVRQHLQLTPALRRIVLTHTPELFSHESIVGQLDFTNERPKELVARLEEEGHTSLLIVGGSQVYTDFYNEHLINELHITIEPTVLGDGIPAFRDVHSRQQMTLHESKRLNTRGAIHAIYKIKSL